MPRDYSSQEIANFVRQGYKPHERKVKKYTYLTLRKGNMEISLGSMNEEKWRQVNEIYEEYRAKPRVKPSKRTEDKLTRSKGWLKLLRAEHMMQTCTYNVDGECRFWRWGLLTVEKVFGENDPLFSRSILHRGEGVYETFIANANYCDASAAAEVKQHPSYIPRVIPY